MIPFLGNIFAKHSCRSTPTPPPILLGEGLRVTDTLDIPYRIACVRHKSGSDPNIHGEIVVREPSGKEITGNLTSRKSTLTGHELYVTPNGPLLWSKEGKSLYFSRQQVEAFDTVTGEIGELKLLVPDRCWSWLFGRTNDEQFLVSHHEMVKRGNSPGPFPAPNSETISLVNPATNTTKLLVQENENEYLWKYAYYPGVNLLVYCLNHRDDTINRLVAVDSTNGKTHQIPQPENGLDDMTLAPDGTSLVACNEEGLHRIQFGSDLWETFLPYGQCPVWSPDGSQIAFMDGESCLCVIPADGGPEYVCVVAYFEGHYNPKTKDYWHYAHINPIWSPDGRFLWFTLILSGQKQTLCMFVKSLFESQSSGWMDEDGKMCVHTPWETTYNAWKFGGTYHHRRVGVIDLEKKTVWIGEGEWNALSWCPVKE